MMTELIYKWLRFDLWNQIEEGKDWWCIASSAAIDQSGHGIVVWCDEDNDGKYFDITIRENYSENDWGDHLDASYEECTNTDSFEELERVVIEMLNKFSNLKEAN